MKFYLMDGDQPDWRALRETADKILDGGVMIYPTDTIYGIGCDVFSRAAIDRVAAIKHRDKGKPFSFVCRDVAQISEFAFVSNWAYRLMNRCLPGPYTFILEARRTGIPKKMIGKRNTVGIRIPDNPVCAALMDLIERPIVTTSVNISGEEPVTDPSELDEEISNQVDVIISVGALPSDPSTVVDLTGNEPLVIREGKGEIVW